MSLNVLWAAILLLARAWSVKEKSLQIKWQSLTQPAMIRAWLAWLSIQNITSGPSKWPKIMMRLTPQSKWTSEINNQSQLTFSAALPTRSWPRLQIHWTKRVASCNLMHTKSVTTMTRSKSALLLARHSEYSSLLPTQNTRTFMSPLYRAKTWSVKVTELQIKSPELILTLCLNLSITIGASQWLRMSIWQRLQFCSRFQASTAWSRSTLSVSLPTMISRLSQLQCRMTIFWCKLPWVKWQQRPTTLLTSALLLVIRLACCSLLQLKLSYLLIFLSHLHLQLPSAWSAKEPSMQITSHQQITMVHRFYGTLGPSKWLIWALRLRPRFKLWFQRWTNLSRSTLCAILITASWWKLLSSMRPIIYFSSKTSRKSLKTLLCKVQSLWILATNLVFYSQPLHHS